MISTEEKLQVLKTLLNSKAFSKSTTSNILLKYLIESSIEKKDLNATDIGFELFGSKYVPEKSEATVRVNVYHLRSKLKKYFSEDGINDPISIKIKTGQYGVSFYRKEKPKPKYSIKQKALVAITSLTLLIIGSYFFIKLSYKDPVWNDFFKNDKETTLYLYDIFGYYGPTLFNKMGWHRDYEINTPEDFYNEVEKHPDLMKNYSPGRNIYVNFLSALSVNDLSKHFFKYKKEFNIHKFHDLSLLQLKEQNSIYLGPLRGDNAFVDFLNLKSKHIKMVKLKPNGTSKNVENFDGQNTAYNEDRSIEYKDIEKGIDTIITLQSNGSRYEHVLVAKLKGDNNTTNLFFFSNHGFGGTAAIDFFTNTDSITNFNNKYLKNNDEFISLFHVNGKERTSMSIKQVLFDNNK
ncbi:hypothetical protein MPF19_03900 [Polaribacter sp. Z014]|uniref:hypothetical protein n=1 Tax=Polaribacter sp. Z014 TaxID=2927126 RepID=UPI0020227BD5|nr:hypothetical protein [Polaribacter sp. Z014]MCL7762546.1 hypothetical protein [Polaribacter sp. Z014]